MEHRIFPAVSNKGRLALLTLILLLAFALRAHDAGVRSLWEDEGWTMLLSKGPGVGDVVRTMVYDQHPPLYFVLLNLWRGVAGETEFATRFLGILIGVVAVAGIAPLGRALFGAKAGVLAALLLALADLHIDLSQEVRHYALMATFAVLSSLFYVRWVRHSTRASRVGWVLTSLALMYTHYLGAFVLMTQGFHLLLCVRPRAKLAQGVFLLGAVGVGFLPWLPVVIRQNDVRWDNPLYYQNSVPNSIETYRAVRQVLFGSHYGLMAGLMLLGLVTLVYARRAAWPRVSLRPVWPVLYPALWIELMTGLTVYINSRSQFLTERNFLLIVPAIALLIAHGLTNLDRTARLFLVTVIVAVGLTTVDARRHYPDWRAVVRNVTQHHLDDEPVLMDIWVGDFPARYYVDRQMGEDTPRVSLREWRDTYKTLFLPTLLEYLNHQDAFWLIYWGDAPLDEYGDLIDRAGFQRTAALSVDHLGTPLYSYRYDKIPAGELAAFGDLFALRRADVPPAAAPGDTIEVALWWSADQTPPLDYSVSVFLTNAEGATVAQHDSSPLDGHAPTSGWQPGSVYFDAHLLAIPPGLPLGSYEVGVRVYWYGDGQPLAVSQENASGGDYAAAGTVNVE
ncbi:MAG TPA: glycosyltransferase family 39 protein [Aggregatilinea sp.]|uniref:glycosyltransferase family 39 protein n=1 Tax=Aggregatilinea sp. TaxID=2806333 RepID=UPI002CEC5DC1|nr:glycosyltransferase family 39 protein [Aggregatilinea sp.]HML24238.1 glycosyltransferase family 39 protein [Aggregatilinea sp.]